MFKADPEKEARKAAEKEQRDAYKAAREAERAAEKFAKTPAGQARAARERGDGLLQIVLSVAETNQRLPGLAGVNARTVRRDHMHVLDSIEAEGWRLEHVGYVWQPTGMQSRERMLHSGEQTVMSGHLIGVYVFRAYAAT